MKKTLKPLLLRN